MSAFMMPAKTTAVIAEYLALAANEVGHCGTIQGVKTIEPSEGLVKCLDAAGCYDEKYGQYDAAKIYEVLCNYNRIALEERYGEEKSKEMCGENGYPPFEMPRISILENTRREWLANLYTVARCYLYQISEGKVCKSDFYKAFTHWINLMAARLAEMVVEEVRPAPSHPGYKTFDEF